MVPEANETARVHEGWHITRIVDIPKMRFIIFLFSCQFTIDSRHAEQVRSYWIGLIVVGEWRWLI